MNYHISSHSVHAQNRYMCPFPDPTSVNVAIININSGKPAPSDEIRSFEPIGIKASNKVTATASLAWDSLRTQKINTLQNISPTIYLKVMQSLIPLPYRP